MEAPSWKSSMWEPCIGQEWPSRLISMCVDVWVRMSVHVITFSQPNGRSPYKYELVIVKVSPESQHQGKIKTPNRITSLLVRGTPAIT